MEEERRKVYVEVDVTHRTDGTARPQRIKFENGEVYEIDRVKYCCRAHRRRSAAQDCVTRY